MKRGNWGDRLEQRAQSFQHTPLCLPYKPRLARPWQPSSVWRVFPRQSSAIAFSQSCKEDVHVFALEKEHADMGQRIYLVTSYSELWHYYRTYRQSLMHCYEIIPDGAVCKLYFDLEFQKVSNRALVGKSMVTSLIQYVCEKLEEVYGLKCSSKDVLNLDSSTEDKFSRHLIFLLPNAAFKDNSHVGYFIHDILQPALDLLQRRRGGLISEENGATGGRIETSCAEPLASMENTPQGAKRKRPGEQDLSFLLVKNKEGQGQLFVDLGVYTKNRNFRLYKSSKLGKNAAFTVAADNQFIPKPDKHISAEESIFLSSLISNVSFTGQRILTCDVPETREAKGSQSTAQQKTPCSADAVGGHHYSPYKEVDDFVMTLVSKDGTQGSIRRWNYFVSEQLLIYDILNYRWCENVGRFHKSNNIMVVVDLKEEVWYQRCHDPECKRQNYRSSSYPLPQDICISYLLRADEEDQEFLMDEVGNIELSQRLVPAPAGQGESVTAPPQVEDTEACGDWADDPSYLEALEEVERSTEEEVPDELLLLALAECEN